MEYKIKDLIQESSRANSSLDAGPTLQAFTRAAHSLVYEDLVAVQETDSPVAALYGARYLNSAGDISFLSNATYSGALNDRTAIAEASAKAYSKGDLFKKGDLVYVAQDDFSLTSADFTDINKALITKKVRYMSDAGDSAAMEFTDIAEVGVKIDRWDSEVKTRKSKTAFSLELMQDMEANQLISKNVPFDLLSTIAAEDTNKDITQKLLHISKVHTGKGVTDGVQDLSELETGDAARIAYATIIDMGEQVRRESSYSPTFILASTKVCTLLKSSGWVRKSDRNLSQGITRCGLEIYADDTTPAEYAVVGFKHKIGDLEYASSLFYSPYSSTYSVVQDVKSFNDNLMIMNRYALSVNPWTMDFNFSDNAMIIQGDDWDNLGGKSPNSRCVLFLLG